MASTYDTLVTLLVEKFQVDPVMIRPGVTFEDLEIDSLFMVELMLVVQSDLGIKIDENTADLSDTIEAAAESIHRQLLATRPS